MESLTNNTIKNSPFKVLDIDVSANKKEILRHVVGAMKKRQYDAKSIAEAQKLLFNPLTRAVEEFQYFITTSQSIEKQNKQTNKQKKLFAENYTIPTLINFTYE